jgi:hypothetical protein
MFKERKIERVGKVKEIIDASKELEAELKLNIYVIRCGKSLI